MNLRQCSRCLLPGVVATDPDVSDFYLRNVRPLRWRRDCKRCVRTRVGEHPRASRVDRTGAERQQRWRERNRVDPERARRQFEIRRARDEVRKLDDARQLAHLEAARIAYHLRRERAGAVLVPSAPPPGSGPQGKRLDPDPLRAWLAARKLAYGSWEVLARACIAGEESAEDRERTLHRICDTENAQRWVSEAQVDQILSREGSTMLSQLYSGLTLEPPFCGLFVVAAGSPRQSFKRSSQPALATVEPHRSQLAA